MNTKNNKSLSIPIHFVGIAFIIVLLLILSILGWYTNQKITMLQEESIIKTNKMAKKELDKTLSILFKKSSSLAKKYSNWDETIQQLQNPTYYKYWQINRVPKSGFTPDYFDDIELYNKNGLPLSESSDMNMPLTVLNKIVEPYVMIDSDHAHLYQQASIMIENESEPAGFLVIKIDITQALNNDKFRFLDIDKLKYTSSINRPITISDIYLYFSSTAVVNSEFIELEKLFDKTLINISIASIILFSVFLFLSLSI